VGVKAQEPTNETRAALGDWYARPVSTDAGDFVACMNEVTYLSILVPMVFYLDLPTVFSMRLSQLLTELGVSEGQSLQECARYRKAVFARTQSRRILGILNEIAFGYQVHAERHPLAEVAHLSRAQRIIASSICGAPDYIQPYRDTEELLCG
jgi:hypothetical protein